MNKIVFNDLRSQYLQHKAEIDAAVARALDSGWYILGQETAAFEVEFADYCAAEGCVGVNSGTDALQLALRASAIGQGDEVITVAHTAIATVAAIRMTGATPVLVDIEPATYSMAPAALEAAITPRTKAVIPVHIYGHPAAIAPIVEIARYNDIRLIEDCAQAHGARYAGKPAGSFGDLACYSFYPTKNLGAIGDGGAVVSSNLELLEKVRLLREYGWTPKARYVSQVEGINSRLDELQAAILRVKLRHLEAENEMRRTLAAAYSAHLPAGVIGPVEQPGCRHVYHLYVVRVPERDAVRARLAELGVGTAIHYPVPVHLQPAYQSRAVVAMNLRETERAAGEIVSLPLHPGLSIETVEQIASALASAVGPASALSRAGGATVA